MGNAAGQLLHTVMGKKKAAKKGIVGRIFRTLLAILCLLVILVTGIGLVLTENPAEPVSLFGWRAVSANDRLSYGEIEPGSLALLREPAVEEIGAGDRVIYPVGYDSMDRVELGIHTVSAVEEGEILILSDTPLPTVRKSAVFGKVVLVIPYLGQYLDYAATSYGMLLAFGVPLVILIVLQIISLILGSRRKQDETEEESDELPWAKNVNQLSHTQAFTLDDGSADELFVVKKPAQPEPKKEEQPFQFQKAAAPADAKPDAATREFSFPPVKEKKKPAPPKKPPVEEAPSRKPYIAVQGEAVPVEETDAVSPIRTPAEAPAPPKHLVFVDDGDVDVSKLLSDLEGMQDKTE